MTDLSNPLVLAIRSRLPLIHVTTDDTVNIKEVLSFLAGNDPEGEFEEVKIAPISLPKEIKNTKELNLPPGIDIFYTSSEVATMAALYRLAVDREVTFIFVNGTPQPLMFKGGILVPPKELVNHYLKELQVDDPQELLPAFGGLTLKDIGEVAKMTATRDESVTVRGINLTRRGYSKLQGIAQVDTDLGFYMEPDELKEWLAFNTQFFHGDYDKLRPRGLLFDGPPGTGKTQAAKAIATAFGVPLYRLDLGTMMGKYVGDSEGNLNAAIQQIDEVSPCVVIFDEVEKVFRGASSGGDSGVTSRMLSQLLWWLQEHKTKVFTVMTTNDIGSIPAELYRPGRIDTTMRFAGIGEWKEGYDFARQAMKSTLKELGQSEDINTDALGELSKRVKKLFSEGAVPQARIVETVNGLVKEVMAGAAAIAKAKGA